MIECTSFKSFGKGKLQGFADLLFVDSGLKVQGCSLFMDNGKRWVAFPQREYKDEKGEKKYASILFFPDRQKFIDFQEDAKRAIDRWCEEVNGTQYERVPNQPNFDEVPF